MTLILDPQDDLWEPGSTLRWPVAEARLVEHPGHGNQKSHGRRGTATVDVSSTELANISAKTRAKMEARADAIGMPTVDDMADNLVATVNGAPPALKAAGMTWYPEAHAAAQFAAESSGYTLDQTSGVLSANSPQRHWDCNRAVAFELMGITKRDEPFEINAERAASLRPPVKPGMYRPSELTPSQIAYGHPGLRTAALTAKYALTGKARSGYGKDHYGQIADSVEILRGKPVAEVLTGVKTRNFYNNIYDPRQDTAVTVDDWAYKAALGDMSVSVRHSVRHPDGTTTRETYTGPASGAPYATLGPLMQSSPHSAAEGYNAGLYPLVAEAYTRAATRLGILPNQLQAIAWVATRGE